MKGKFEFSGKGGESFSILLKGILLSVITLGIYYAWYQMEVARYLCGHASIGESAETA